ncbi:hypothetical protein DW886_17425 [Enterocloster aldenensis]|nr:hypothetical protein DW886_17425 [Enterocloster aldenensis]
MKIKSQDILAFLLPNSYITNSLIMEPSIKQLPSFIIIEICYYLINYLKDYIMTIIPLFN